MSLVVTIGIGIAEGTSAWVDAAVDRLDGAPDCDGAHDPWSEGVQQDAAVSAALDECRRIGDALPVDQAEHQDVGLDGGQVELDGLADRRAQARGVRAVLGIGIQDSLQRLNGTKNVLAGLVNAVGTSAGVDSVYVYYGSDPDAFSQIVLVSQGDGQFGWDGLVRNFEVELGVSVRDVIYGLAGGPPEAMLGEDEEAMRELEGYRFE